MKKSISFLIGIYIVFSIITYGQQPIKPNEFKIGIFGASLYKTHNVGGCEVPYEAPLDGVYKTSVFNVLSADGFNIYQTYAPSEWTSENSLKSELLLANANGLKVEIGAGHYYKPAVDINGNYLGYGTNVYDNCNNSIGVCQSPYSQNYFRANIKNFINNIYKVSPYKDIIWGYHICEEASYYHYYHFANNCQGNVWGNPSYFKNIELPPTNVSDGISYFKNSLSLAGITNHKMIVMEANHHKNINTNTNDGEGVYNPQQYIQLLNKNDNRDVFFEGSYFQYTAPWLPSWLSQNYQNMFNNGLHYLGSMKSIDYAKNFSSEVHKIINIQGTSDNPNYLAHYHSNLSIPNANWLWFQAYTSIIHGAKGVWFWWLVGMWQQGETNNWNTSDADRFEKSKFPNLYKSYLGYLAQEIRYLVNKDIISTDVNTVVTTKTDFADPNCIVPSATSYIPTYLPSEKRTENYGLRYTIRSNGTETYMIITNPLNVAVSVTLNFSNSSNQQIQSSTGVNVLFDNNQYPVTSGSYKVNRNSNLNLTNGTVGNQYYIGYAFNKQLPISFGPMDVKILKFVSSQPNHNNGWDVAWSNFGSGNIYGHNVKDGDLFYMGDFDGDGTEELLCVAYTPNGANDWITILKYVNDNWEWYWSNYGSSSAGNGIYPYRNNFIIGDYDGDGKDELLGNNINGWTTLFKFNNGNWQWIWSDNGNASHPIRLYKDKFYAGDFNGDGKDELFGCDLPNGWTTTFKWNGSNFIWDWSDYGSNQAIRQYRTNMLPGDFDGDGKVEMLGFDGWSTLFHFDNGNWQWKWSTYGANDFNGWTYPPLTTDRILAGNLDTDNKDELFFLQTHSTAAWSTTMDLKNDQSDWNWNWSANSQYSVPFIDDWPLAASGGSNTRYYLVKAKSNEPKYLLAMRKFCGNYLVNMYKTNSQANYKMIGMDLENDSIAFKSENDIAIFPNPSDGKIQILSEKENIKSIEISDPRGQIIYSEKYNSQRKIEIDLSKHPTGIYLVKIINTSNSVSIRKIILNR